MVHWIDKYNVALQRIIVDIGKPPFLSKLTEEEDLYVYYGNFGVYCKFVVGHFGRKNLRSGVLHKQDTHRVKISKV